MWAIYLGQRPFLAGRVVGHSVAGFELCHGDTLYLSITSIIALPDIAPAKYNLT